MRTDAQLQHYKPTKCYETFVARTSPLKRPDDIYFDAEIINDLAFDFINNAPTSSRSSSSAYSDTELDIFYRRSALYKANKDQEEEAKQLQNEILKDTRNDDFMRTIIEQNEEISPSYLNDDKESDWAFQ